MKKVYAGMVLAGMLTAALFMTGCPNPTGEDPVYSIALDPGGAHAFPAAFDGYEAPAALTVTVSNTGNQDTGALTIARSGTNAAGFRVSKTSLGAIAAGGTDTFTVVPNTGLAVGTYSATIRVGGENDLSAEFTVSFTVNLRENYSIRLSATGTYNFPAATVDYGTQAARTITITNTGNRATGALTIGKSGENADGFTVSKTAVADIAAQGSDSFTVVPNTGLGVGTHTATITVSGGNSISASFNLSFRVNPITPTYSVGLSETGSYNFGSVTAGYAAQEARAITVTNTGNQATGALTIGKSGTNPDGFRVSKTTAADIAVNGTDSFTVVPAMDLGAGNYTATITVSGGNNIRASFSVSFRVNPPPPQYGVGLSETGTYEFPGGVAAGYEAQEARTVTVSNTGNRPTGTLTIAKSGANPAGFTAPASLTGIAAGDTGSFTVAPAMGLEAGNYAATITVSGGNGISESFNVSFTVGSTYRISLSATGTNTFSPAAPGYTPAALTVRVANTGDQPTGALTIAKSGANPPDFTAPASLADIAPGETGSFTVVPAAVLGVGAHTATITVGGGNGISASFVVSFTVNAPVYRIGLSDDTLTFRSAIAGYSPEAQAERARTVTVTNTGNQATGDLTVEKSGANAVNFTVFETGIPGIAAGGTGSFTVVPNTTLPAGAYTASVTVRGGNGINESVALSFTVNPPGSTPSSDITLDLSGTYTFPGAVAGYDAQAPRTVLIRNTGDQATGALTIDTSGSADFTLSKSAIADIGISASNSFTVAPAPSLGVGTYTTTITVSDGVGINKSFTVSFNVVTPVYSIDISETAYVFPGAAEGYGAQAARTVTVRNTGNLPTGSLTIAKSGANTASFTAPDTLAGIAVGGTGRFTVAPVPGLLYNATPYAAIITVNGGNGITGSFTVSFAVDPAPVYGISLTPATPYVFPAATAGYSAQAAYTVTVTNTGDQPTGTLTIRRSGANANSFTAPTPLSSIGVSGNDSFTVVPNTGLVAGTYTATIEVRGANGISETFDVSFTVKPVVYTVTFSAPGALPATSSAQAIANSAVGSLPPNPTRNGYTFNGWYTAETGGNQITATTVVRANATVYARWLGANANLSALSVSAGTLTPPFAPGTKNYALTVPSDTASINVSAAPADGNAGPLQYSPGNPVSLNAGITIINVKVTAEDGITSGNYRIAVTRPQPVNANANLSSLGVNVGMLVPAFSPDVTAYTVLVPTATPAITVSAAATAWNVATVAQSPGNYVGSPVALESPSTAIAVTVTAQNGSAKTYTITVNQGTAANEARVSIGITDQYIDLARDSENDLSQELNNTLRLTAPGGGSYTWLVDGLVYNYGAQEIVLYGGAYPDRGTHSVLLEFLKDGVTYGCEVLFKVVR
jgi:uncharacterized repeat protein (TIGR02543 family)